MGTGARQAGRVDRFRSAPAGWVERQRRTLRYGFTRAVASILFRMFFRLRLEGRDRLPPGPAVLCFSHQSWTDPFVLMASLPWRPRLYLFGPKEEDMSHGTRNRLMTWSGTAVPYKPGKGDLREVTRRVQAVLEAGGVLAIAGEGRIHAGESSLLPLSEGPAFFALRTAVPIVPVAINGTSWLAFGRRIRVRIGTPIMPAGRPTSEATADLTEQVRQALSALCAGYPDPLPPRPGSFWARATELFNDWPEGDRPATPPGAG